jgi:hypothetical protein
MCVRQLADVVSGWVGGWTWHGWVQSVECRVRGVREQVSLSLPISYLVSCAKPSITDMRHVPNGHVGTMLVPVDTAGPTHAHLVSTRQRVFGGARVSLAQ